MPTDSPLLAALATGDDPRLLSALARNVHPGTAGPASSAADVAAALLNNPALPAEHVHALGGCDAPILSSLWAAYWSRPEHPTGTVIAALRNHHAYQCAALLLTQPLLPPDTADAVLDRLTGATVRTFLISNIPAAARQHRDRRPGFPIALSGTVQRHTIEQPTADERAALAGHLRRWADRNPGHDQGVRAEADRIAGGEWPPPDAGLLDVFTCTSQYRLTAPRTDYTADDLAERVLFPALTSNPTDQSRAGTIIAAAADHLSSGIRDRLLQRSHHRPGRLLDYRQLPLQPHFTYSARQRAGILAATNWAAWPIPDVAALAEQFRHRLAPDLVAVLHGIAADPATAPAA